MNGWKMNVSKTDNQDSNQNQALARNVYIDRKIVVLYTDTLWEPLIGRPSYSKKN